MAKKTSSKALATKKSTLPANWKKELAESAREESDRTQGGGGNAITLKKNGQFGYQGADLGDQIECIIVDHVVTKKFYDREYDEDNPGPPACFALKPDAKNIAPHADSPNKQAEICEECPHNEWGSGRKRGKACKDKQRLAIMLLEDIKASDSEELTDVEMPTLEVPVTSNANFNKFVKHLTGALELPSWACVVKITMDDSADWQKLKFEFLDEVPEKMLVALKARAKAAREVLMTPFDVTGYQEGGGKKKAVSKKTGGKKTAKRSRLS